MVLLQGVGADFHALYGKLRQSQADLKAVSTSLTSQVTLGWLGVANEIAKAVVFLASDECSYAVGSELQIDGGFGII